LGEPVVYTPGSGSPVTVTGIFDEQYVRAATDAGQAGISTVGPACFFGLSDLPTDPKLDAAATVTRGGKTYVAHEVEPDGNGGTLMFLHLTS
jgi:hypothetical protein